MLLVAGTKFAQIQVRRQALLNLVVFVFVVAPVRGAIVLRNRPRVAYISAFGCIRIGVLISDRFRIDFLQTLHKELPMIVKSGYSQSLVSNTVNSPFNQSSHESERMQWSLHEKAMLWFDPNRSCNFVPRSLVQEVLVHSVTSKTVLIAAFVIIASLIMFHRKLMS